MIKILKSNFFSLQVLRNVCFWDVAMLMLPVLGNSTQGVLSDTTALVNLPHGSVKTIKLILYPIVPRAV